MNLQDISKEENLCIEELKKRISKDLTLSLQEDETLFYRFSKARDFVIADAEAMLRKHIIWREQYKVDRILTDYKPPEVLSKYKPFHFLGYDKEGSPVIYFSFGNCDIKGVFKSITTTQFCSLCIYTIESALSKMREQTKKLRKPVTMMIFILDFENFTFANATNKKMLETLLVFAKMFQDNYPERLKHCFQINTSFYFSLFFNVVKYVLATAIMNKILNFGADDDYQGALLEKIDADVLPAFLGGTRTDPDGNPLCTTVIPPACKIPESFYLENSERLSRSEDAQKLTVTRLSKEKWSCEVNDPGSYLEWEFETMKKDIGFTVLYKATKDCNPIELLPKQRINTCHESEKGFVRCEKPGTYICVFDNYSLMFSKELYFKIQVTPPREMNTSQDCFNNSP